MTYQSEVQQFSGVDIQVDCFAVGLGSSMLLQFNQNDEYSVRVLVDGGDRRSSKKKNVHWQIADAPEPILGDDKRIDLIIGTHYDADHLKGLVPIINDHKIEIGEIWLPAVQMRNFEVTESSVESEEYSLVRDMLSRGNQALLDYISQKFDQLDEIDGLLSKTISSYSTRTSEDESLFEERIEKIVSIRRVAGDREELKAICEKHKAEHFLARRLRSWLQGQAKFLTSFASTAHSTESRWGHDIDSRYFDVIGNTGLRSDSQIVWMLLRAIDTGTRAAGSLGERVLQILAGIKRAPLKDAITATHLAEIVAAIRKREAAGKSVRVEYPTIPEGEPRFFNWTKGAFVEVSQSAKPSIRLTLMAPSSELVTSLEKYIPIGIQIIALISDVHLPAEPVTPSNRLSIVARFDYKGASILITGDTGFSDFTSGPRGAFFPKLLNLLGDIDVIQVAHHGGRAHWFYRAIQSAVLPIPHQTIFLLSHSVNDSKRPNSTFKKLLSNYRTNDGLRATVLFTSQPLKNNVAGMSDFVHPQVSADGRGPARERNVRLIYSERAWTVKEHGIVPGQFPLRKPK